MCLTHEIGFKHMQFWKGMTPLIEVAVVLCGAFSYPREACSQVETTDVRYAKAQYMYVDLHTIGRTFISSNGQT